jgi:hypothetical protein
MKPPLPEPDLRLSNFQNWEKQMPAIPANQSMELHYGS